MYGCPTQLGWLEPTPPQIVLAEIHLLFLKRLLFQPEPPTPTGLTTTAGAGAGNPKLGSSESSCHHESGLPTKPEPCPVLIEVLLSPGAQPTAGVAVAVGVAVSVGVRVGVAVLVRVGVEVLVGVAVRVAVAVLVGVSVLVLVG